MRSRNCTQIKGLLNIALCNLTRQNVRVVYHTQIQQNGGLFYTVLPVRATNRCYSQQIKCISEAWWWIFWYMTSSCIRFIDYFMSPISLFLDKDGCFFWNEIPFAISSRRDDSKVYFYWSRFLFCTPTSLMLLATPSFYPKRRQGRKGICPPTADILF